MIAGAEGSALEAFRAGQAEEQECLFYVAQSRARDRLIDTVSNILSGLRREEVLQRAFEYWRNIDQAVGNVIEAATLERRG